MPRMRTIKPGFFTNEELCDLAPLARLLFAGLWCWADRDGRLEDRPRRIRAEILPYDDCDVEALLAALAAGGFIVRYAARQRRCIQIVHFGAHQNPHYKEPASTIPPPSPNGTAITVPPSTASVAVVTQSSANARLINEQASADAHAGRAGPAMGHESWAMGHGVPAMGHGQAAVVHDSLSVADSSPSEADATEPVANEFATERKPTRAGSGQGSQAREGLGRGGAARRRALLVAFEDVERWRTPANSVELAQRVAAARALLESAPPVTPAEVGRLVARWDQDHDPELCTPMALARNLTQLRGPPATKTGRRRGAPFRDDRSAAEKAREPVRVWRELNATSEEAARA